MADSGCRDVEIRLMRDEDLPDCQRLKEQVGWNQSISDWQRFLSLNPAGCFLAVKHERIVGTVCTIAYESFGWVAMVIVDPNQRRAGIGKQLLLEGIHHLENQSLTVKLDATPAGKLLYDTLGFVDEYGAARFECESPDALRPPTRQCEPLLDSDLDALEAFDTPLFGNTRRAVFQSYLRCFPHYAFCVKDGSNIVGCILAREGTQAHHIGPWLAADEEIAASLFVTALETRRQKRVFLDIVDPNPRVRPIITPLGFRQQRPFIRMYKGENLHPGKPEFVYSMSGPELG